MHPKVKRGGVRTGAGRPRRSDETVPHAAREPFAPRHPLHVTMRMRRHVWNLRSQRAFRVVERALRHEQRLGLVRFVHYSVQGNHLHLVVEAPDGPTLGRRMQGFAIRLAKGLNALMGRRRGRVLAERYHLHVLRTPTEVRNALRYVLTNAAHHHGAPALDPYSSGSWFDGWYTPPAPGFTPCTGPPAIATPRTWLLSTGWRLAPPERPHSTRPRRHRRAGHRA